MPNYADVSNGAIKEPPGGGKTFVGPVDDPFFVDLGAVFDGINIDKPGRPMIGLGNQGGGKDDVSGYNVHSFVLQVPASDVTRDGKRRQRPEGRATPSSASGRPPSARRSRSTGRANGRVPLEAGQPPREPADQRGDHPDRPQGQVQRDVARRRREELRRQRTRAPEPAAILNALFDLGIKENNRTDIVQALLTGVPGLTQISRNAVPGRTR